MSDTLIHELALSLLHAPALCITAHDRPDGDALGAVLGLARLLRQQGKKVHLTGCRPISESDRFLLEEEDLFEEVNPAWITEGYILVVLDAASAERAEVVSPWRSAGGRIVVIDHHVSNHCFGDLNWISAEASSTSEMILQLAEAMNWELLPSAASALWVGIVTDTGRFTYENTSASTLHAGARLVTCGASPSALGERIFQNRSRESVLISGRAIQSLRLHYENQLGSVHLAHADFEEFRCGTDAANDVVNIPRSIQGVSISLFFYEMAEGRETKLSIRSAEPFNATELAGHFGGGGHCRAAGCTIPAPLAEAEEQAFAHIESLWGEDLRRKPSSPDELTPCQKERS